MNIPLWNRASLRSPRLQKTSHIQAPELPAEFPGNLWNMLGILG